jgi:outer membrane protein OmpA-like peptidoglycan-associated protein
MTFERGDNMKKTGIRHGSRFVLRPLVMALAAGLLATACATTTPVELTTARASYARASAGPAAQLMPAELHKAKSTLDTAEAAFAAEKDSPNTIDLSYIAERNMELVESQTRSAQSAQTLAKAKREYEDKQRVLAKNTRAALVDTRKQLVEARSGQAQEAQQLGVEHAARQAADSKAAVSEQRAIDSEQKATEANDALAKLAAKDEARGLVITLSGGVLFRSNESTLLPAAQTKLDEVAAALISKGQTVVVEGYTDSKGSASRNRDLSQQRADSVRSYLVTRGFPAEKIVARGMGPDRPVAENTNAEGRANNRRVEIIVAKSDTQPVAAQPN